MSLWVGGTVIGVTVPIDVWTTSLLYSISYHLSMVSGDNQQRRSCAVLHWWFSFSDQQR